MTRFLKGWTAGTAVVLAFVFVSPTPFLATDVFTDPVGFITLHIAGGPSSGQLSYLGLSLTRLVEARGIITGTNGVALTDASATWTNNQFNGVGNAHFIELTSGPGAGITDDIVATAEHSVTTASDLSVKIVPSNTTYRIYRHWTIGSVFGTSNTAGLKEATTASQADNILVFDPSNSSWATYYYRTGTGWRLSVNPFIDQQHAVLYFDEGVLLRRRDAAALELKLTGAVKMGQTSVPIVQGLNLTSTLYPVTNLTLATSNLYTTNSLTGFVSANTASQADNVLIWNGSGFDTYYYRAGAGWRLDVNPFISQDTVALPLGGSVFIRRRPPAGAFDWVVQQPFGNQ